MPIFRKSHPNPDLDGTDSSGHSDSKSSSSNSDSNSDYNSNFNSIANSDRLSTQSQPRRSNTMRENREEKLRAKQERIFTNMDPFSLSSPSRQEQEYPVSPKSLPSRGADPGAMVQDKNEELEAQIGSKRAHQNHPDDDRPWPACKETRGVAMAGSGMTGSGMTGASANLGDSGKEGSEGGAVTASVDAGILTIAGLLSVRKT